MAKNTVFGSMATTWRFPEETKPGEEVATFYDKWMTDQQQNYLQSSSGK